MVTTVTDNLESYADELKALLRDLLLDHSELYRWNPPNSNISASSGDYGFRDLDTEGRQLQSRLLTEYRHFGSLLIHLLDKIAPDAKREYKHSDRTIMRAIEQNRTWHRTANDVLIECNAALDSQFALLHRLYDPSAGEPVFVPDTNALMHYVNLADWCFEGVTDFTIILLPTVLSELDRLKVSHRDLDVRRKAQSLIRQIKEFRRRGRLLDGVPVVSGQITLRSIAAEPASESYLPWFDPTNNDDRILASVLEVMATYPRSPVTIVTLDINMQNKAEYSRIPYVEPPDPDSNA